MLIIEFGILSILKRVWFIELWLGEEPKRGFCHVSVWKRVEETEPNLDNMKNVGRNRWKEYMSEVDGEQDQSLVTQLT